MPELPEMEALRRALDDPVRAFAIDRAGPAHIATLKTFDPPLSSLDGERFAGARRRGKRLILPVVGEELSRDQNLGHAGSRERRDSTRFEAGRGEDLVGPSDASAPCSRCSGDLLLVGTPVTGNERKSRAPVADEEQRLDDLRA